jgi:hypothetical protein
MEAFLLALKDMLVAALYPFFVLLTRYMQRGGLVLCAYKVPEGSLFQFSSTFAATKAITAITNADPAVVTSVAHGYVDDDLVMVQSGWEEIQDSVVKINQTAADTYEMVDINTTSTTLNPAGAGVGTTSLISSWQTIPQVLTIDTQGGDPAYTDVEPLSKRQGFKIPVGFNAAAIELVIGHDASNAVYKTMLALSRAGTKVAFRMLLSGGEQSLGYGYLAVAEVPKLTRRQVNTVKASITFLGRTVSYDS